MAGGSVVAEIILAGREWLACAAVVVVAAAAALLWAYTQARYAAWIRLLAALLKIVGIVLIAGLVLEPMFRGTRPRPGSNLFVVVADNSKSLQLADPSRGVSRGE